MKKNTKRAVIFLTILLIIPAFTFSQEINEANYLKEDSIIWVSYEKGMDKISEIFKSHPEKKDSLLLVSNLIEENSKNQNCSTAVKYASVPSGLQRLFMLRMNFSKDTLLSIWKDLPLNMQESNYGKSLYLHINTKQVEETGKCYDFEAFDTNGNKFLLSSLTGKNILLLYGGLACIREDGRSFLKQLYGETNRETFQIVVFWDCSRLEQLKELKTKYLVDYIFVSDFLKDHSPMKINYGAQATPTCFLIDKVGTISIKSVGLPQERLTKLKEEKKL